MSETESKTAPMNGDELLAKIQPRLRVIRHQVCMRPDLMEQWEDANAALTEAREGEGAKRLNGPAPKATRALAEKVQAIEKEIDEVSPWFEFRAMPIAEYQALVAKHPPRDNDQMDEWAGHNRDAVLDELVRACLVDPVFSDEGWKLFLETCAPSEWAELRNVAVEANGGAVKPPKSLLASQVLEPLVNESA